MIEIEVQNETHQTQDRIRFAAVPRIGEGIRLRAPDGMWASYDVLDVWYQKAEYGDIWMPYVHVKLTPGESDTDPSLTDFGVEEPEDSSFADLAGELEPFKI
ncbi:hypothetical protein [uncultured Erythrobacter sp.]|uniref:hypothetical protein n=1 Tax=uncultured Erythrobacter sp. TaxID=263913 RepID=UPI00262A8626|nr:hypothetical protein [uncultured Erythrobacter sp.]